MPPRSSNRFARVGMWTAKPGSKGKAPILTEDDKPEFKAVDEADGPGRLPSKYESFLASLSPRARYAALMGQGSVQGVSGDTGTPTTGKRSRIVESKRS